MRLVKRHPDGIRPIVIGNYTLTERGLEIHGKPGLENHLSVGDFIRRTHQSSGLWLADWLAYGEGRHDWQQQREKAHRLDVAVEATGLTPKRLKNIRTVASIAAEDRRPNGLELGHHELVTSLTKGDQAAWLDRALAEGWSVRDLRLELKASKRRKVIRGQAVLKGLYRVIYADPPWQYSDRPQSGSGQREHYDGMSIADLCRMPVRQHTMKESALLMWVTAPMMLANPGPREVVEAWGFEYKTFRVWNKHDHCGGHYFKTQHEALVVATRGSCLPDHPLPMLDGVVDERKTDDAEHSEKPASFRKDIERMWDGPYLEMFARERTEGWDVYGDDAALVEVG